MTTSTLSKVSLAVAAVAVAVSGLTFKQLSDERVATTELRGLINALSIKVEAPTQQPVPEPVTMPVDDARLTEFIMNNPQTIVKSLTKFQFEEEQKALAQENSRMESFLPAIYQDKNDPFFGNPDGQHVVVEWIDYNCGYCKRLAPAMKEFVATNPEAKVIIKEFPIFQNNPTSAYSSLMGTAVFLTKPDLYAEYHDAIISQQNLTMEMIDGVVVELGLSKEQLQPVMATAQKQLEKNRTLGAQLNINGTPTLIVNGEKRAGNLNAQQLTALFN